MTLNFFSERWTAFWRQTSWSSSRKQKVDRGYAINPARDLGPRLAHTVLPIAGKGKSDWGYAWILVIAPLIGGVIGAGMFTLVGF